MLLVLIMDLLMRNLEVHRSIVLVVEVFIFLFFGGIFQVIYLCKKEK